MLHFPLSMKVSDHSLLITETLEVMQREYLIHYIVQTSSADCTAKFVNIFGSFIDLPTPISWKKLQSLKDELEQFLGQEHTFNGKKNGTLEMYFIKRILSYLEDHLPATSLFGEADQKKIQTQIQVLLGHGKLRNH